ncbi:MAG: hypothetical protein A2010_10230 [Nitrospirae bacterium GWD2_57_9]|nr:MAG: hypothetical protein A2010_10230 [Nitrospirae bacterium GWD2_57_9]
MQKRSGSGKKKTCAKTAKTGSAALKRPSLRLSPEKSVKKTGTVSRSEMERLFRERTEELRIHQIELETQNEELRTSQRLFEASRRKYADLYDLAPVGYFSLDTAGLITEVNLTGAGLLGYDKQFLLSKPFLLFIESGDRTIFEQKRAVFATGSRRECEIRLLRKDGSFFYARLECASRGNKGTGDPGHIRMAIIDITERKQADELNEAMGRIHTILHAKIRFDSIMQQVVAEASKALGCDTAAVSLRTANGWTVRYVSGLPASVIGSMMNDEEEPHAVLAIQTKEPVVVNAAAADPRVNREHLKKWGIRAVMVVPILEGSEPVGVIFFNHQSGRRVFETGHVNFARELCNALSLALANAKLFEQLQSELHERGKAEKSLRRSEEELRAMFDSSGVGISQADPATGRLLRVNRRWTRMMGYAEAELKDMTFSELTHPDDRQADWEGFSRLVRGEIQSYEVEKRLIRKDGGVIWCLVTVNLIRDAAGKPVRTVGVISDITDRRLSDARILRQNRMLDGINRILGAALTSRTEEDLGSICLAIAEEVSQSKFGFIGDIGRDDLFYIIAMSSPGWDPGTMNDKTGQHRPAGGFKLHGLYGRVLVDGKPLLANNPASHEHSIGLPQGHPPLTAILGVPLRFNGKIIGMIGLANRKDGYTTEDSDALASLSVAMVQALMRKRAEQALRVSEERYRSLVTLTPFPMFLSSGYRIQWTNPAAVRIFNARSEADLLGRSLLDLFHASYHEDIKKRVALLRKGMFTGTVEEKIITLNGEVRDVEVTPVSFVSDTGFTTLLILNDTTERKQAEASLRENEEQFERLFQATNDGIVMHPLTTDSIQSTFIHANDAICRMLGYSPEEMKRLAVSDIILQEDAESVSHEREIMLRDRVLLHQKTLLAKNGSRIPVEINTRIFEHRGVLMALSVIRDITERKRSEEALQNLNAELSGNLEELAALNREQEAFIYSVSHDLREPLRSIAGFSELLAKQYDGVLDKRAGDYLNRVTMGATRMNRIIDDLLQLSGVSRRGIARETVDMSGIAAGIIGELREAQPDRKVAADVQAPVSAEADPGLIELALSNLLRNAWKFTAGTENARIEFGAAAQAGKTVYYVKDNGAGFDPELAGRLFLPFQRLHPELDFEGTGIGLAIVDRIVRRHGGAIWAEGKKNAGAAFYFTLT